MSDSLHERMAAHLQDLFVLEVNTVVKAEITARPTGSLSQVLFQLVDDYSAHAMKGDRREAWMRNRESRTLGCVVAQIDAILQATDTPEKRKRVRLGDKKREVGRRIHDNCLELQRMFHRLKDREKGVHHAKRTDVSLTYTDLADERQSDRLDQGLATLLSAADRSRLRKIGDLGLEAVMCQTRVHLDGDVVTRIATPLLVDPNKDVVMELHKRGVARAVRFWTSLAQYGRDLIQTAFGGAGKSP